MIDRRGFLLAAALVALPWPARADGRPDGAALNRAARQLDAIEARVGGRLGVAVFDSASGATLAHRADERFPFCSTFKLLAAAAILRRVDEGRERLDRRIAYGAADVLDYAPATRRHLAKGAMSVEDLCAAAVTLSDNTAANLLVRALGGPAGLTRAVRAFGDDVFRLDRMEPELNAAVRGDVRDTTSPRAMASDVRRLLVDDALSAASRRRLEGWMVASKTGLKRLRAGVPAAWQVGDKTGTGMNGTANVVAILRPPARPPLLAAVYLTGATVDADAQDAAHAEIGRLIVETF
jgi:beta-lactamase class A